MHTIQITLGRCMDGAGHDDGSYAPIRWDRSKSSHVGGESAGGSNRSSASLKTSTTLVVLKPKEWKRDMDGEFVVPIRAIS